MSVLPALKCIVVPPRAVHSSTIIFLHGLGDTGAGWKPVADMLAPSLPGTKWILPTARIMPVTLNFRMPANSWFDIASLSDVANEDEQGLRSATREINEIITAEVDAGLPANKIILGGFSQGCALTLLTGLTTERKLAGLACLSGWLPLRNSIKASVTDHARDVPVFWGHGTEDELVDFTWAQLSVKLLQDLKVKDITFKSYEMGHSSHPQEIRDLKAWIEQVLGRA